MLHASATSEQVIDFKRHVAEWNEFIVYMHDQYIDDLDRKYRDEDGKEAKGSH